MKSPVDCISVGEIFMKSPTDYTKLSVRVSGIANSYGNVAWTLPVAVAFGKLHEILLENSIQAPAGWNAVRGRGKQSPRIPYNFHLESVSRRIDEASGTNARLELTTLSLSLLTMTLSCRSFLFRAMKYRKFFFTASKWFLQSYCLKLRYSRASITSQISL